MQRKSDLSSTGAGSSHTPKHATQQIGDREGEAGSGAAAGPPSPLAVIDRVGALRETGLRKLRLLLDESGGLRDSTVTGVLEMGQLRRLGWIYNKCGLKHSATSVEMLCPTRQFFIGIPIIRHWHPHNLWTPLSPSPYPAGSFSQLMRKAEAATLRCDMLRALLATQRSTARGKLLQHTGFLPTLEDWAREGEDDHQATLLRLLLQVRALLCSFPGSS